MTYKDYHWQDDHIYANDCGFKVLETITFNVEDTDNEIC